MHARQWTRPTARDCNRCGASSRIPGTHGPQRWACAMPMADDLGNVRAALAELTDIELGALIATANDGLA